MHSITVLRLLNEATHVSIVYANVFCRQKLRLLRAVAAAVAMLVHATNADSDGAEKPVQC